MISSIEEYYVYNWFCLLLGLDQSFFGIVIISQALLSKYFTEADLTYLFSTLMAPVQRLHAVWYHLTQYHVEMWDRRIAGCAAMHAPPESVESIAQKMLLKLAGNFFSTGTKNLQIIKCLFSFFFEVHILERAV